MANKMGASAPPMERLDALTEQFYCTSKSTLIVCMEAILYINSIVAECCIIILEHYSRSKLWMANQMGASAPPMERLDSLTEQFFYFQVYSHYVHGSDAAHQ